MKQSMENSYENFAATHQREEPDAPISGRPRNGRGQPVRVVPAVIVNHRRVGQLG
jgi:hypothetical protein